QVEAICRQAARRSGIGEGNVGGQGDVARAGHDGGESFTPDARLEGLTELPLDAIVIARAGRETHARKPAQPALAFAAFGAALTGFSRALGGTAAQRDGLAVDERCADVHHATLAAAVRVT